MMDIKEIAVEVIGVGPSQSRHRLLEEDIDVLATSMEKIGLLEPVVVHEVGDGRYELLTGQRRLLAAKSLGWEKIPAVIIESPPNPALAKAISLTENFVRTPLAYNDLVDACTALFNHYGSMKAVAEETGLPYHKVREYVKADRLIPLLRELVDKKKVVWPLALKAQDAATRPDGTIDEDRAARFSEVMKTLAGNQRKNLTTMAQSDPTKNADEIIEAARKPPREIRLKLILLQQDAHALDNFARDENTPAEDAAANLVVSGLREKGY